MAPQDLAFVLAGGIGLSVAVVHGVLTQRYMVRPVGRLLAADGRTAPAIGKLVPLLLHYSTVTWFLGGIALIAASLWLEPPSKTAVGAVVGGLYLYGVIGNAWATRGRHPGWMLLAVAIILIVFGVSKAAA
jgi:hypothetical protein